MTYDIDLLTEHVEQHPADFKSQIKLKKLIREYGIELDRIQNKELHEIFWKKGLAS